MQRIIQLIKISLVSLATMASMGATAYALPGGGHFASTNDSKNAICQGVGITGGSCGGANSGGQINSLIRNVINLLSAIVGIVAVIMIIVAGLRFITSGGDSNKAASAKGTLIYAIVGLVIVALAQVIVRFVLGKV